MPLDTQGLRHDLETIGEVVGQLDRLIERAREAHSRVGYFAALYRQVTLRILQGIESGLYDDGARMSRLAAIFANRYFDALGTFAAGGRPTRAWRVAHEATADTGLLHAQHLLLAMNAHINLDLAIAAAEVAPGETIHGLEADFGRINDLLADLTNPLQVVLGTFSPLFDLLDRVGGRSDEHLLDFSIQAARSESWMNAEELALSNPERRARRIDLLDRKVKVLSRLVCHPGILVGKAIDLIRASEVDDVPAVIDALNGLVEA